MSNVDEICLMHEKVLRQQVRKQTLEEVLKELKKIKKMIETYILPLSEYERGRYEHAWNMILKLEQKIKDVSK